MSSRTPVLVLCHANRYRSPLAEAYLNLHGHIEAVSAGFLPDSRPVAKPIRERVRGLGFNFDARKSTEVNASIARWAHIIVVMNDTQLMKLQQRLGSAPSYQTRTKLGSYLRPRVSAIPDLGFIATGSPEFERVVDMIREATAELAKCIKEGSPLETSSTSASGLF